MTLQESKFLITLTLLLAFQVTGFSQPNSSKDRSQEFLNIPDDQPEIADCGSRVSEVALEENFDAGIPGTWTVVDNFGNGLVWGINTDSGDGNYTSGAATCASVNSDAFGVAGYDTELISPEITIPTGGDNVELDFNVNYRDVNNPSLGSDQMDIDISTDGGMNWTNIDKLQDDIGGFFAPPGVDMVYMLDAALAGSSTFHVRFRYYNPDDGDSAWDWYAQIDDVLVTYCSDAAIVPTLSEWAVIILALTILIFGIVAVRMYGVQFAGSK